MVEYIEETYEIVSVVGWKKIEISGLSLRNEKVNKLRNCDPYNGASMPPKLIVYRSGVLNDPKIFVIEHMVIAPVCRSYDCTYP